MGSFLREETSMRFIHMRSDMWIPRNASVNSHSIFIAVIHSINAVIIIICSISLMQHLDCAFISRGFLSEDTNEDATAQQILITSQFDSKGLGYSIRSTKKF